MKHFYIIRERDGNNYNLYWAPRGKTVTNGEEITRAEAVKLCRAEHKRHKHVPYYIMPYGCREAENPGYILRHRDSSGFIIW